LVLVPVVVSGSLKAMLFMSFDREIDLGVGFEEEARLISDLLAIVSDYYRLKDVVDELERVDAITQVANFKAFHEELYREWIRARESGHTFALILVHVTGIKECNDILGHVRGDELLRFVANTVRSNVRSIDFVARYGSAKFAVILPETDKESAVKYAEKIRDSFSMSDWAKQKFPVYLDISVVAFPEDGEDEKVLLGKLESRLVEAMRKKGSDVIYK
ncbi:MAG: GGDEF domain-containing protein, partial [candidate division WOR-3 bacterium]